MRVGGFVVMMVLVGSLLYSQVKEDAEKWIREAEGAKSLVEGVIKAVKDKIVGNEDALPYLREAESYAEEANKELENAKKLCAEKKWKECQNKANWSWQLWVKSGTAILNAKKIAGLE